jgi:hypothetical protein
MIFLRVSPTNFVAIFNLFFHKFHALAKLSAEKFRSQNNMMILYPGSRLVTPDRLTIALQV